MGSVARRGGRLRDATLRVAAILAIVVAVVGIVVAVDDARPARARLAVGAPVTPTSGATLAPPRQEPTPAATAGTPASQVYPFRPTELKLPSGATAPIDVAGVGVDGSLSVPADPSRVGWWDGGALVDEPYGSVVLAGHLDSREFGIGVLVQLRDLHPGDELVLSAGEQAVRFRVTSTQSVPKALLGSAADAFAQDVPHRLVLITCSGPYDRAAHAYPDNLVVIATPVR